MKHVVIVGAGFGGLVAAQKLALSKKVHLTIIDKKNHHLFQPLLYQVAMAGLSPAEIATPIRSILKSQAGHLDVLMAEVTRIDLGKKAIEFADRKIFFDYLLLACGATHSYFGHEEWEENAPGLKTIEEATEIRRRVLWAFECAEKESDPEIQKELLTFVIVGGGPTGVELAGALAELSRYTLSQDFSHIDPKLTRIVLIEAGPRLLPSFGEASSQQAADDLDTLGVSVWTSKKVTKISGIGVEVGGEFLKARTILWAAGVKPSELNMRLNVELDKAGRILVQPDLSLKEYPDVFVIGDQACFIGDNGRALPGIAPVAMQQARLAAKNIQGRIEGKSTLDFHYTDKGQLATIGRGRAVVEMGSLRLSGFLAWITWLTVHIYFLIGFRNRVFVLLQWAWSYLRYSRGARLIINKEWRQSRLRL